MSYRFIALIFLIDFLGIHEWATACLQINLLFNLWKIREFSLAISFSLFLLTVKEREVRERFERFERLDTDTVALFNFYTRRKFSSLMRVDSFDNFWIKLLCFWFLMCSIITVFSYRLFRARDFLR